MSLVHAARPLDPWRWLAWPALLCAVGTLLFTAPIRVFGLGLPEPVFPLILAFAWAMIRPSVLGPFALLAFGLFLDACWGGPLGLWPVALLAGYALSLSARGLLLVQGDVFRIFGFVACVVAAMAAAFLVNRLLDRGTPDPLALLWQVLATLLLYPFAHRLIVRFEDADVRFR